MELFLSGVYIVYAYQWIREGVFEKQVAYRTIIVGLFTMGLNMSTVIFEYTGSHIINVAFKSFVYSVKIKAEFYILHILRDSFKNKSRSPRVESNLRDSITPKAPPPSQMQELV